MSLFKLKKKKKKNEPSIHCRDMTKVIVNTVN